MAQTTGSEQFNVQLPPDVESSVMTIKDQRETSKAEVVRSLVERGLEADSRQESLASDVRQVGNILLGLGIGAFIVGQFMLGMTIIESAPVPLALVSFGGAAYIIAEELRPKVI